MPITIGELKKLGRQAEAAKDLATALKIQWRLVDAAPHDIEPRLKVADLLTRLEAGEGAKAVYEAVVRYGVLSGHPLVSLVVAKVLEDRGEDVEPMLREIARHYSADSDHVSKKGQRISHEHPDTEIDPPDLHAEMTPEALVSGAARAASDLSAITDYPETLHRLPLLSDLPADTFVSLCRTMRAIRLPDQAMLIREGEMGRSFFLLALGQVRVFSTDIRGQRTTLARLGEGALFGEMAVIHASPRTASVQVMDEADLLEIDSAGLATMASDLQPVAEALDRFTRERLLNNLMATSPLFRPFSRKQRLDLLRRFTGHEVQPDTVVINEGDEGRGLYVVLSGEVEVTKDQDGEQVLLATLKAGDVFGEISLIKGYPATATVRTVRRSTILFLDRVYFKRLVDALPEVHAFFDNLSEERLHDTRVVLADDDVIEVADDMIMI
jgi:CRP-like cAMP-binding protein